MNKGAITGSTVHVVPVEGGVLGSCRPAAPCVHRPFQSGGGRAREIAANQPSQVVLLDEFGRLIPIAHYQLPRYPTPQFGNGGEGSVFEAAVKALLIGGLLAAGVAVLGDVVEKVHRELEKGTSKPKKRRKQR